MHIPLRGMRGAADTQRRRVPGPVTFPGDLLAVSPTAVTVLHVIVNYAC